MVMQFCRNLASIHTLHHGLFIHLLAIFTSIFCIVEMPQSHLEYN